MLFSGLEFMEKVPFTDVVVHATVLTKDGRRMSKSLGTGIDPLEMIRKYGTDATRFGLMYQSFENQEIRFNQDVLSMGKKFCNKLWNISRFVLSNAAQEIGTRIQQTQAVPVAVTEADKVILESIAKLVRETEEGVEGYNFGKAAHSIYDIVWHDFADVYIEISKNQMNDEKTVSSTREILAYGLLTILKVMHPFTPFITEEIWGKLGGKDLLMVETWPKITKI